MSRKCDVTFMTYLSVIGFLENSLFRQTEKLSNLISFRWYTVGQFKSSLNKLVSLKIPGSFGLRSHRFVKFKGTFIEKCDIIGAGYWGFVKSCMVHSTPSSIVTSTKLTISITCLYILYSIKIKVITGGFILHNLVSEYINLYRIIKISILKNDF